MRKLISMLMFFVFAALLSACGGENDALEENAGDITQLPPANELPPSDQLDGNDVGNDGSDNDGSNNDNDAADDEDLTTLVFGSESMESLENHLSSWRTSVTDTRDFHIFQDAGLIIEARLSAVEPTGNINVDMYLHYFNTEDGGSLMAWAQSEIGNTFHENAATLVATVELPSDTASILEIMQVVVPTLDGWVLHVVPYSVSGYNDGVISFDGFTTSAGVAFVEDEDFVGIPFSEPVTITFGSEGMENIETHIDWFPPRVSDTRDFHIFQDDWVVLEARISDAPGEDEFTIDLFVHYFLEEYGGLLSSWVNNQYSDALEIDFAILAETVQLPSSVVSITSSSPSGQTTWNDLALADVKYYVDNYADDFITIPSFSTDAFVATREDDALRLSISDPDVVNRETYFRWMPSDTEFPYSNAYDFYIFEEDRKVIHIIMDAKGAMDVIDASDPENYQMTALLHDFSASEGSVEAWVNNLYSDALMLDPADDPETTVIPLENIRINDAEFDGLDAWGNSFYIINYTVDNFSNDVASIEGFSESARVPVRKSTPEVEPPVNLVVDESTSTFEAYRMLPLYGVYRSTQRFYIFEEAAAVIEINLDNLDGDSTIESSVRVNLFKESDREDIHKWVNNRYSDGLYIDPPNPRYSLTLDDGLFEITEYSLRQENDFYYFYDASFEVAEFSNNEFSLQTFNGSSTVVEERDQLAGPCVHNYNDAVLHIDSATGIQFGTEYTEIILSDFSINGVAVHASSVIRESSSNVVLSEENNSLLCTLPCSFGEEAGEWEFNSREQYDISTTQTVMADYQTFVGGCPSFNDHGTHTQLQMEQGVVTIQ